MENGDSKNTNFRVFRDIFFFGGGVIKGKLTKIQKDGDLCFS